MAELAYVALGSNLGDRVGYLASARASLSLIPETRLIAASQVEETAPLGGHAQAPYMNQMVALRTGLSPEALLDRLHRIEHALGRTRVVRWGPRTIDLDVIRFGSVQQNHPRLVLPHPGLKSRDFWQREVRELDALVNGST